MATRSIQGTWFTRLAGVLVPRSRERKALLGLCVALGLFVFALAGARATGARPLVLVAPIEGMIDLGLAPFVDRVLREAEERQAEAVVFEINTFGGRVDAAVAIRDSILRSSLTTVAFVNPRAISAGALISLGAQHLVMTEGATIGAATPVQVGGDPSEGAKPVDEKTVSYVRKEFRSTADARERPGLIAEAMVDSDVEIPGLIEKGKLLTLTTEEALEHGLADFTASNLDELLAQIEITGAQIEYVHENWAERIVRFFTHPVVASLLMTLALLGLIVEIRTPGFGIPGAIGIACFAAFFWGHWLVQLVGWEEVLLLVVGGGLLVVEVLVLPGFGVAGGLGIAALIAGLTLSLFGSGATFATVVYAFSRVAASGALAMVGSLLAFRFLPMLPVGRKLVLQGALSGGEHPDPELGRPKLVGSRGSTLTPLRPAGLALLQGQRVDVVSEGEFIDAHCSIEVVSEAGNRIVVRLAENLEPNN